MGLATYDLTSDAYFADPYPTYAVMRKDAPVYQLPGTNLWYEDLAEQAEVVHRFFSDWLSRREGR
jgi:hypothetical protein